MREDHAAPQAAGGILRARTHGGSAQSLGIGCEGGASDLIDFSVNVNPAGPSPRAVAALQSGNCLTVRRAALRTRLIRIKKDAFYQTLYRKFNAGRSI